MSFSSRKPKPVQHIELSDNHRTLRIVLICILLVIAAVAFTLGLLSLLNGSSGWQIIQANSGKINCSGDFVFRYNLGQGGSAGSAVVKKITALYEEAAENAYWLFNSGETSDDMHNVRYLNDHINEVVTVDEVLYRAFAQVEDSGCRYLYLAPVYVEYDNLVLSETDNAAGGRDPAENPEMEAYFAQISEFINNPAAISVELLGENKVRLNVSDAYLAFAAENEIDTFIDFHWMKNAFIIDYFADVMTDSGYTAGYFASNDGFTRNLDTSGTEYCFNLFDREDSEINLAAKMVYNQAVSIVFFRNYPLNESDRWRYYGYADGRIVTPYIDPGDGFCKSAVNNLVSYSRVLGCAETVLKAAPVFIADTLRMDFLSALAAEDVYSVWCEGRCVCYNEETLVLSGLADGTGKPYTSQFRP